MTEKSLFTCLFLTLFLSIMRILLSACKQTPSCDIYHDVCSCKKGEWIRVKRGENYAETNHLEDTGVGIAEDEMEKVFQHFEQTSSGRRFSSGTGLELAISREYVRMMGATLP